MNRKITQRHRTPARINQVISTWGLSIWLHSTNTGKRDEGTAVCCWVAMTHFLSEAMPPSYSVSFCELSDAFLRGPPLVSWQQKTLLFLSPNHILRIVWVHGWKQKIHTGAQVFKDGILPTLWDDRILTTNGKKARAGDRNYFQLKPRLFLPEPLTERVASSPFTPSDQPSLVHQEDTH